MLYLALYIREGLKTRIFDWGGRGSDQILCLYASSLTIGKQMKTR